MLKVMNFDLNPEFIERYQLMLEKDPKSKLFAPLAEGYRRMGLMKEAEDLCVKGVKLHPHFPSGLVVYAKILIDKHDPSMAVELLKQATDLSPENILAQRLLAQCLVELKRPKEALKAFKMVLFLNPNDENAVKHVRKLESLTADEYDDELFEMKPLGAAVRKMGIHDAATLSGAAESSGAKTLTMADRSLPKMQRILERAISLADAFMVRSDFDKAIKTIDDAEEANKVFDTLMGSEVAPRKSFIQAHAKLANLDI